MLNLSRLLNDQQKLERKPSGKQLEPMSTQQAKILAISVLANHMAPSQEKAVDLLSVGGIMTANQIGVTPRVLRKHRQDRVVDRLPHISTEVEEKFRQYGLPTPENVQYLQLYTLGPVGIEISKMRYDIEPPNGYLAYTLERAMHDVALNEFVLRIAKAVIDHGWNFYWIGEREATLYRDNRQILKPDALIRLTKDDEERFYLIEYHNEDKSTRAAKKVRGYEQAYNSNLWQQTWNTHVFPPILAVFRKPIVGHGYKDGLQDRTAIHCDYYGMTLSTIMENPEEWYHFNTEEKRPVFPWTNHKE